MTAFRRHEKLLSGIALCFFIVLLWSWVYGRISLVAWQTPLGYGGGDECFNLAIAKAFMDGDIFPVLYKWVPHLNAPFSANWNDYPLTEEFIFAIMGWLGKIVGLFPAANFMVLLAHLLAGLSFWYVGRELNYRSAFAFSGAILFAFSHYIFARNFGHIVLTYYWHVPLMLLVTWWAYSSRQIQFKHRKWFVAVAIAAVSGTFNPYYSWMFLQFLGFAVLLHLARKQYHLIRLPLLLIGVTMASFIIMNADTFSYSLLHGANIHAVSRNLAALELYALKIPALVFPPADHSWHSWANYGQSHYFLPSLLKGEDWSPYLGMVGLVGSAWLAGTGLYHLLQGRLQLIPVHAWQALWILLFSLVGGINLLLGTFGLILFRGTNRFSIFILAIVLLFLVRQLSRQCPKKWVVPVAFGIAVIGLWDQLPPKASAQIQQTADLVQSDHHFARTLETQLTRNSMVFQLPVVAFPENTAYQMTGYDHFRPYLFTQHLRYSYGTNKGRGDADWQTDLSKLAPVDMAAKLETLGFGAIMINRKGYEDKGVRIINELVNTNRQVICDNGELVAIRLKSGELPVFSEFSKVYSAGWSVDEGTHRWAMSNRAEIKVFNNTNKPRMVTIGFSLITLKPRNVKISMNGETSRNFSLSLLSGAATYFKPPPFTLAPGQNSLFIETDVQPEIPGNGDMRKLSFGISNFVMDGHPFLNN
jgi:phosphoglycerol transferase